MLADRHRIIPDTHDPADGEDGVATGVEGVEGTGVDTTGVGAGVATTRPVVNETVGVGTGVGAGVGVGTGVGAGVGVEVTFM